MKIKILRSDKDGYITLSEEALNALLQEAYNEGYAEGNSKNYITYKPFDTTPYVSTTGNNPNLNNGYGLTYNNTASSKIITTLNTDSTIKSTDTHSTATGTTPKVKIIDNNKNTESTAPKNKSIDWNKEFTTLLNKVLGTEDK